MITQENTAIIIPARLQASRLPNKPLLEIHGKPMIQHVWERAVLSQLGEVLVATDSLDIKNLIEGLGGNACTTSAKHTSGTDRIYESLNKFDLDQRIQFVINLQGDLPTINSEALSTVLSLIEEEGSEMGTLASVFSDKSEIKKNQVVKAFCDYKENENSTSEIAGLSISISACNLKKCDRCWYHVDTLVSYGEDNICLRCKENISGKGETRFFI